MLQLDSCCLIEAEANRSTEPYNPCTHAADPRGSNEDIGAVRANVEDGLFERPLPVPPKSVESTHPIAANGEQEFEVTIPNAQTLELWLDPRCQVTPPSYVQLFSKKGRNMKHGQSSRMSFGPGQLWPERRKIL